MIRLGDRTLSGKVGIDCATATIYLGAMTERPLVEGETMCGEMLKMAADRPLICAHSS